MEEIENPSIFDKIEQELNRKQVTLRDRAILFGGSLVPLVIGNAVVHNGPALVTSTIFCLGGQLLYGDKFIKGGRETLLAFLVPDNAEEVRDGVETFVESVAPSEPQYKDQSMMAKIQRARFMFKPEEAPVGLFDRVEVIDSTAIPVANGPMIAQSSTVSEKVGDMSVEDLVALLLERGALRDKENEEETAQQRVVEIKEDRETLHTMPYREYLKTRHWQRTRTAARERANYHCQVCRASGVQLDVHHNTYDRRGYEENDDLIVLCHECHELFEFRGKLPKEAMSNDVDTEALEGLEQASVIMPSTVTSKEDDETVRALPLPKSKKSGMFRFSELLATGFRPTMEKIFVGRTMEGKDIFLPATDLCHVAIAGKTGGGKGSLMRLIMVQLCSVGAHVLLLNPHYMRWVVAKEGQKFDEDWTPFEGVSTRTNRPYLEGDPIEYAETPMIEECLEWAVEKLLKQRIAKGRHGGVTFPPYFIVLDEWPSIVGTIKDAPEYLSFLLREGRKFGVFVILASQDFQQKTIGMEGGSARKCLLTTFYTGGDRTTGKELLNMSPALLRENELGKGIIWLRCTGTDNEPVIARVPFVDNEAVYELLGPSTFKGPSIPEEIEETLPTTKTHRTEEQNEDVNRAQRVEIERTSARAETDVRPPVETTHETHDDAQQFRLNDQQVREFCALYPDIIRNKDDALRRVGAHNRYRDHANELIEQYNLKAKIRSNQAR